jgi:macrodomain Ter protein organizer (MatP/YcbG family)
MRDKRGHRGRFSVKEDEHRSVKSIRATEDTWERFKTIAAERGMTPADFLQQLVETGYLEGYQADEESSEPPPSLRARLEDRLVSLLDEPRITRSGKDRGTVKRVIEAVLSIVDELGI